MRTLLSMLIVLIVCVAAVGLYRGWFTVSGPNRSGSKVEVQLSVDPDKIKGDAAKATDKATGLSVKAEGGA